MSLIEYVETGCTNTTVSLALRYQTGRYKSTTRTDSGAQRGSSADMRVTCRQQQMQHLAAGTISRGLCQILAVEVCWAGQAFR